MIYSLSPVKQVHYVWERHCYITDTGKHDVLQKLLITAIVSPVGNNTNTTT
jgi:hypothetical protein